MAPDARAIRTAFVGCGNLGMAVVFGALRSGALLAAETLVVETDGRRREEAAALGVRVSTEAAHARDARTVVLAVKPQSFRAVAHSMGPLAGSQLVVSVMAGHGSGSLRAALGGAVRVVRAMPNTAAQVGMAVTALARGEGSVPADMDEARHLFEGVGRTVDIEERLVDAAVATVGSGPAYLFLLAEAEIAAAVRLGIPEREARAMVTGTLLGSATLLDRDGRTPAELRAAVTSEGGTTAAAMKVFEARGFAQAVDGAMAAACARSAELSS